MGRTHLQICVNTPEEQHTRTIQTHLDIKAESLNQRERWLVERLKNYRDLELEIKGCYTALLSSPEPPSTTIRPPDEDDPYIVSKYQEPLKQWQKEIASTIEKHVDPKWKYVTVQRVHNILAKTYSDDTDEDYAIRDAADATKRPYEERVELTPTERAIVQHEEMQVRVRVRLVNLEHQKIVIETALGQMQTHYPEWYELLWRRFVVGEKYVSFLMSKGMSEKFYRNERRRALQKFDKLAIGLR